MCCVVCCCFVDVFHNVWVTLLLYGHWSWWLAARFCYTVDATLGIMGELLLWAGGGMGELQGNEWTFFTPPLLMRYPGQTRNPCLVPVLKTSQICCYKLQANIGLCFYFPSYRALYYLPPSSDCHPISRLIAHRLKGAPLCWLKAVADLRCRLSLWQNISSLTLIQIPLKIQVCRHFSCV